MSGESSESGESGERGVRVCNESNGSRTSGRVWVKRRDTRRRMDMNKKNNYPGAGTYELMNKTNANQANSPRFSMGKETRDRDAHKKE